MRGGVSAGEHLAPDQPDDEVREPGRHDRGGRLPLAHPAALCGPGGGRDARCEAVLHAVLRWLDRRPCVPGQGRDPLRPRGGHRGHGAHGGHRGPRQGDRLRHGRHIDRCVALRRRLRARIRNAGGGRSHACSDDEHPHRGRGRGLHPGVRRFALSCRPRERGRQPGPRQLPARWTPGRDRCERDAGQDPAAAFPQGVRPARERGLEPGGRAGEVR
ncbi:hypothetical protein D9M69_562700 [compost metagenome]